MEEIRTPNGKLYGILDVMTYTLYIKDGANTRLIQVPLDGITLGYIAKNGQPETISVPPMADNPK